jgi:RNA polymerase sigma-70 factor, ECF subfamily
MDAHSPSLWAFTNSRTTAGDRNNELNEEHMSKFIAEQIAVDLSEKEAIKQAQQGNAAAFEQLYKTHCKRVYSLCLRMVRNPTEAEDLTQQAFLQLFRKIGTFRGDSGLATWLHKVTVNVVLMHIRRKKPTEALVESLESHAHDDDVPRERGAEDKLLLGATNRISLLRALRKLPRGYKQLFLLHDVAGYEHHEIAVMLGCSLGCSKSQLHRARRRLRLLLNGEPQRGEIMGSLA